MIKIITTFLFSLCLTIAFCQTSRPDGIQESLEVGASQWVHQNIQNGYTITYDYSLQQNRGTKLTVSLIISDGRVIVDYGSIELTTENVLSVSELNFMLKSKYSNLFALYGKNSFLAHLGSLNSMVKSVKDTLNSRNEHSFVYQGLRMFQSIFKGALRDINNDGSVNFTLFGGYQNGLNSFECEEDLVFNVADFKSYLNSRKTVDATNVGIDYFLGALNSSTSSVMTFSEIQSKLDVYFDNQNYPSRPSPNGDGSYSKVPQGGQCGCCGNYSGNCYYWSSVCLAHDMACQQCQWQACFGGCVPGSCSGNTISWYWFLV